MRVAFGDKPKEKTEKRHATKEQINATPTRKTKQYAYYFVLDNNRGAGTFLTTSQPEIARQELERHFFNYKLKVFALLN